MRGCEGFKEDACQPALCEGCDWNAKVLIEHAVVVNAAVAILKQVAHQEGRERGTVKTEG